MRVAVYSGSFDPLHIGHESIMRYLSCDAGFDCIYLIVSPQSPFKDTDKARNAVQRCQAAREAAARHPELRLKVDDLELYMPAPHYTIRTLDTLKAREPGNDFTLVIGGDNLASFRGWKDYARILLEYGVIVFPREGCREQEVAADLKGENPDYKIEIASAPLVNISSSWIRERLKEGEDVSEFLM